MNRMLKAHTAVLVTAVLLFGCSSTPETQRDPYNDADSQRSRASEAQRELSSDTNKQE